MAVDVSKIPNNNKFDPVRQAILDLQGEISSGVAGVASINNVSGAVTLTGLSPITISSSASTSQITVGVSLSVTQNTASGTGTLTYNNGVFTYTPPDLSGFLTEEVNDLTAAVTWANVPDANITQSSVTQHQAALSITESQIIDLGNYLDLDNTGTQTVAGNIVIEGDLTTSGSITYINSTHLDIGDNIIKLNADITSTTAPTEDAGFYVNRGSSPDVSFLWDEQDDRFSTYASALATASLYIGSNQVINSSRQFLGSSTISSTVPYFTFSGDSNTGVGRATNNKVSLIAEGTKVLEASDTGVEITGTLDVSGSLTADGIVLTDEIITSADFSATDNRFKLTLTQADAGTIEASFDDVVLSESMAADYIPYVKVGGGDGDTTNAILNDSFLKINGSTLELDWGDTVGVYTARDIKMRKDGGGFGTYYEATYAADSVSFLHYASASDIDTAKVGATTTGRIRINDTYSLPVGDGTSGQVLSTNGSGDLSWVAAPSGPTTSDLQDVTDNGASTTNSIMIGSSDAPSAKLHIVDGNNSIKIGDLRGASTAVITLTDSSPVHIEGYSSGLRIYQDTTEMLRIDGKTIVNPTNQVGKGLQVYYDMDLYNTLRLTNASMVEQARVAGSSTGQLFLGGNNQIIFTTSDTTAAEIDSSGNLNMSGSNLISFNGGTQYINSDNGVDLVLGASDDIRYNSAYMRYFNTSSVEYARLDGAGNNSWIAGGGKLGINRTSPDTQLDVDGNIYIRGRNGVPTGKGLEIFWYSVNDRAYIESYDYVNSIYKPIRHQASLHEFKTGNMTLERADDARYTLTDSGDSSSLTLRADANNSIYSNKELNIYTETADSVKISTNGQSQSKLIVQSDGDVISGIGSDDLLWQTYGTQGGAYSGTFGWQSLQLGNNGTNYIIGGDNVAGGNLTFVVNNSNRFRTSTNTPNGTIAMRINASGEVQSPYVMLGKVGGVDNTIEFVNGIGSTTYIGGHINYHGSGNLTLGVGGGNISVGSTVASDKLHVHGNLRVESTSGNTVRIIGANSNSAQIYATGGYYGMRLDGESNSYTYYLLELNAGGSTRFTVKGNGSVGIDVNSPQEKLHVKDGRAIINVSDNWQQSSFGTNLMRGGQFSNAITAEPNVLKVYPANGATNKAAGYYWGGISFMHLDPEYSTWGSSYTGAQMWIGGRIVDTPGQERSALVFGTNNNTTAGSHPEERMCILPNGTVGIGTTAPPSISSGVPTLAINSPNTNNLSGGVIYQSNGSSQAYHYWESSYLVHQVQGSGGHSFNQGASVLMRINSAGNVGIGLTSPIAKLTLPLEEESNYKIAFKSAGTTHAGISTVDQSGAGLYIGANSYVNAGGTITYSDSAYPSSGIYLDGWNENCIKFYEGTSGNPTERMRIANGGAVGIGTTAPSTKLDVFTNSWNAGFSVARFSNSNVGSVGRASYDTILVQQNDVPTIRIQEYDGTNDQDLAIGVGDNYANITTTQPLRIWSGCGLRTTNYNGGGGNLGIVVATNGKVGIRSASISYELDVAGTIRASSDIIAYSDARIKENVKTIDNALDKVTKLRGVSYNKIGETEEKIGVIAQEIEQILPQVVSEDDEGMKSVAYGNIVGVLIEAIKEQQKQIDELKARLDA